MNNHQDTTTDSYVVISDGGVIDESGGIAVIDMDTPFRAMIGEVEALRAAYESRAKTNAIGLPLASARLDGRIRSLRRAMHLSPLPHPAESYAFVEFDMTGTHGWVVIEAGTVTMSSGNVATIDIDAMGNAEAALEQCRRFGLRDPEARLLDKLAA